MEEFIVPINHDSTLSIPEKKVFDAILSLDNYSTKHEFVQNYKRLQRKNKKKANYLEFFLNNCKIVSRELAQLLAINFPRSYNLKNIIAYYNKYKDNEIFNEIEVYDNMIDILSTSYFKKDKNDHSALFSVQQQSENDTLEVILNTPNDSNIPKHISAFNKDKYKILEEASTLIKGINKISFCIFKASIELYIKNHKEYEELVRKYEPLLLFYYMSSGYNPTFNHSMRVCMYQPKSNKAIGIELFGEDIYDKLMKNTSYQDLAKIPYDLFYKSGDTWNLSVAKAARNSGDKDRWSKAKSAKDKLELYNYCCRLLNQSNMRSSKRVHNDIALLLYNSSIRKCCYDYKLYKYKAEHNIYSSLETEAIESSDSRRRAVWDSLIYMPFNYSFSISMLGTVNNKVRMSNSLFRWYQKNNQLTDLKDFENFAKDYHNFINPDYQKTMAPPNWTDMYDVCIDMINAMSRQKIFDYLMKEYIVKPK